MAAWCQGRRDDHPPRSVFSLDDLPPDGFDAADLLPASASSSASSARHYEPFRVRHDSENLHSARPLAACSAEPVAPAGLAPCWAALLHSGDSSSARCSPAATTPSTVCLSPPDISQGFLCSKVDSAPSGGSTARCGSWTGPSSSCAASKGGQNRVRPRTPALLLKELPQAHFLFGLTQLVAHLNVPDGVEPTQSQRSLLSRFECPPSSPLSPQWRSQSVGPFHNAPERDVFALLNYLSSSVVFDRTTFVLMLVYLERLTALGMRLLTSNWTAVLFSCLHLAQKWSRDSAFANWQVAHVYPLFAVATLGRMELALIKLLDFDAHVAEFQFEEVLHRTLDFLCRLERFPGAAGSAAMPAPAMGSPAFKGTCVAAGAASTFPPIHALSPSLHLHGGFPSYCQQQQQYQPQHHFLGDAAAAPLLAAMAEPSSFSLSLSDFGPLRPKVA